MMKEITMDEPRLQRTAWRFSNFLLVLFLFVPAAGAQTVLKDPAAPRGQTRLNVVYDNISMGATPIWVTQKAGIFRKHGLDLDLSFARGSLSAQAVVAGSFPIGFVSPAAVVTSSLAGARIKMVAGLFDKMLYMIVTARNITTPAQLKGKRVGISRFGSASETATRFAARELGLDPDRDLIVLQIGNSPDRFAALQAGKIDGMVADPSDAIRAKREGFNILVDLTTRGIDYQGTAVIMTDDFLRDHRDMGVKFIRALVEGVHYFKTRREETIQASAAYLKTTDLESIAYSWQIFAERVLPAKPYPSVKGMQLVINEVASRNPAARGAKPEQFFDTSLMEEVDRSGFIDRLYR
jgi:NitT/TauT family transport system substrate-binding protein